MASCTYGRPRKGREKSIEAQTEIRAVREAQQQLAVLRLYYVDTRLHMQQQASPSRLFILPQQTRAARIIGLSVD